MIATVFTVTLNDIPKHVIVVPSCSSDQGLIYECMIMTLRSFVILTFPRFDVRVASRLFSLDVWNWHAASSTDMSVRTPQAAVVSRN